MPIGIIVIKSRLPHVYLHIRKIYKYFFYTDGHFVVAVSSGNIGHPIRCYRVLVRKTDEKCVITSLALPSFFLQDGAPKDNISKFATFQNSIIFSILLNNGKFIAQFKSKFTTNFFHSLDTTVIRLKFVVREAPDTLVVAANTENSGFIELWELREKTQTVHNLFQVKKLDPFKTVVTIFF